MLEALNSPIHVASVRLAVRDIARVASFYADALGLSARRLSADDVVLAAADGTTLLHLSARPHARLAPATAPGLFHTAFLLPSRAELAGWLRHAQARGLRLEGASDHRVSEAIYLSDPEGNGIEVYVDRPREAWPRDGDGVAMATDPLDGASLMAEPESRRGQPWTFPAGGRIGHVHLKVRDLAEAEAFYREALGLDVMARYPGAVFLSWGGYHHHVALNVWRSKGAPARGDGDAGLAEISFSGGPARALADPDGNRLVFQASASIS